MPSKKEKETAQNERIMTFLQDMLKLEHNKFCADCDSKSPRWASWNLGIFLCIRCAGIHRNLGVHISKVRSVNLDKWTGQQVAMMQDVGNEVARSVYEAKLPPGFRRPNTNSALEQFIRSKYEEKRYMDPQWTPPPLRGAPTFDLPAPTSTRSPPAGDLRLPPATSGRIKNSGDSPQKMHQRALGNTIPHTHSSPSMDLLGIDQPATTQPINKSSSADDLFGDFVSSTPSEPPPEQSSSSKTPASSELLGLDFGGGSGIASSGGSATSAAVTGEGSKSSKDSIMALFSSSSSMGGQQIKVPVQHNQFQQQQNQFQQQHNQLSQNQFQQQNQLLQNQFHQQQNQFQQNQFQQHTQVSQSNVFDANFSIGGKFGGPSSVGHNDLPPPPDYTSHMSNFSIPPSSSSSFLNSATSTSGSSSAGGLMTSHSTGNMMAQPPPSSTNNTGMVSGFPGNANNSMTSLGGLGSDGGVFGAQHNPFFAAQQGSESSQMSNQLAGLQLNPSQVGWGQTAPNAFPSSGAGGGQPFVANLWQ